MLAEISITLTMPEPTKEFFIHLHKREGMKAEQLSRNVLYFNMSW